MISVKSSQDLGNYFFFFGTKWASPLLRKRLAKTVHRHSVRAKRSKQTGEVKGHPGNYVGRQRDCKLVQSWPWSDPGKNVFNSFDHEAIAAGLVAGLHCFDHCELHKLIPWVDARYMCFKSLLYSHDLLLVSCNPCALLCSQFPVAEFLSPLREALISQWRITKLVKSWSCICITDRSRLEQLPSSAGKYFDSFIIASAMAIERLTTTLNSP